MAGKSDNGDAAKDRIAGNLQKANRLVFKAAGDASVVRPDLVQTMIEITSLLADTAASVVEATPQAD
jgi:hypothetical protein